MGGRGGVGAINLDLYLNSGTFISPYIAFYDVEMNLAFFF